MEIFLGTDIQNTVSRIDVHNRLVEKYPDRNRKSLWTTVKQLLPTKLKERGFKVGKTSTGYYNAK